MDDLGEKNWIKTIVIEDLTDPRLFLEYQYYLDAYAEKYVEKIARKFEEDFEKKHFPWFGKEE